jgi:hypothetical protein
VVKNLSVDEKEGGVDDPAARWLAKMSGNWSLTLPLPVATVPVTCSPTPLPTPSCTTHAAHHDFTDTCRFVFLFADLAWML